ncbi:SusD/RagB family nutrient-binding outer membrane lipoprotein [Mariniphaga sediminis]|uniref:SusD/RagB family nutrient-binding outer membrane lipoprotein n=1 Tax=Mariniphaga sediminis TaxID=1628158 RepID=UPI003562746F
MKKIVFYIVSAILVFSSCTDKILDEIDTNPNQVNDAPLKTLLPQLEVSFVCELQNGGIMQFYITEQNTFVLGGNALESASWGSSIWNEGYLALNDLIVFKQKAIEQEAWIYAGIADILKAFNMAVITDIFGDMPYTEAFHSENINPLFDSAEDIHTEIHKVLDEAILNLQKESGLIVPSNDDMIYGGEKNLWIKTAYGFKARLYNKMSNLDPTGSANDALEAISKSFTSQSESFIFKMFEDSKDNDNPFAATQIDQPGSCIGNGIYNTMASFSPSGNVEDDPRANIWFTRVDGKIIAAPNGTAEPDFGEPRLDGAKYSKPEIFKVRSAPVPLLTYIELKFVEAESLLRLGRTIEANTAYETAVSLALEQASDFNPLVALTTQQMSNYKALPKVFPGAEGLTINEIIAQKYIFFYQFQPLEAYNDLRRTEVIPVTDPTGRPNRSVYPESERTRNSNTPLNIDRYSAFEPSTKLFWAK